MTVGLQVLMPNGKVGLDLTNTIPVMLGYFDTSGAANGSHTDSRAIGKELFYFCFYRGLGIDGTLHDNSGGVRCFKPRGSGVISYAYTLSFSPAQNSNITNNTRRHRVYYGVY